jgi:cell division protein FtsB
MAKQGGRPRTERVAVRLPGEAPFARWLRSIRLSGFAIIALGLIVGCVVVLAPSLRVYIGQRQQIAQLQAQVADAKKSLSSLKDQKARWSDPNYIEAQARSRLNYVFPGEYSYLVINDQPAASTSNGQPISDKLQTTQVDWVKSMLSSVFTAGLTDETPDQLVAPVTK